MYRILLIAEEAGTRQSASDVLRQLGHHVVAAAPSEAMWLLDHDKFDVVVMGPEPTAEDASASLPSRPPANLPPALLQLPRVFSNQHLVDAMAGLQQRDVLRAELARARRSVQEGADTSPVVGRSSAMQRVLDRMAAIAESEAPVLLTGESGTGKELLARTIHVRSSRRNRPLVAMNCAALPETLLEAELFGYERGAFTGALHRREGRFKAADGGTLFLDEINGLTMTAQAKLLRVIQDGAFQPLGTNATFSVNVRLISATNQSLKQLVADGRFREDLYYRIKVLDIDIPPLRERRGDLPLLVQHFVLKHSAAGREPPGMTPRAWAALSQHTFPGNVRELEHAIVHALVLSRGQEIDLEHLPTELAPAIPARLPASESDMCPLPDAVREFEREYVARALHLAGGNKTRAAQLLGISRKSLWDKLRKQTPPTPWEDPETDDEYRH